MRRMSMMALLLLGLAGCGQTGALYLPAEAEPNQTEATSAETDSQTEQ
ncbi:LPS translocon maturation chaperone LptM [Ferrimonas marina]|uniref:Lipoprotein-attachment site-containing protein n=1 Tax=Ferrimonas marina TaxID=299255 RepID=A0A1M5XRE2_9GAMM|nr:lipoprotein [Ferrimonas marina]SHI02232.1 lipoprotein-attachment site-containing protein [Ferrimonas marina]